MIPRRACACRGSSVTRARAGIGLHLKWRDVGTEYRRMILSSVLASPRAAAPFPTWERAWRRVPWQSRHPLRRERSLRLMISASTPAAAGTRRHSMSSRAFASTCELLRRARRARPSVASIVSSFLVGGFRVRVGLQIGGVPTVVSAGTGSKLARTASTFTRTPDSCSPSRT